MFKSFDELQVYLGDELKVNLPRYARFGGQDVLTFEKAIAGLEGGSNAIATCSGLSAITTALTAMVTAGDHVLATCNAYGATQKYCNEVLSKFNISITYFNPNIENDLQSKIRKNTKVIFIESPSSIDMALTDIDSIVSIARMRHITTIMDNTWSTPILFRPMEYGIDVVVHSATKYISGDSACVLGVIVCREDNFEKIRSMQMRLGLSAGKNETALALAGLITLKSRIQIHYSSAVKIVKYFEEIVPRESIHFPPLIRGRQYALWEKYFNDGNGLISLSFDEKYRDKLIEFINNLERFSLGFGWGGAKSMVMFYDGISSSAFPDKKLIFVRFSIGLELVENLIMDLSSAFSKTNCDFFE